MQSRQAERRQTNPGPAPEKQELSPLERVISPGSARGAAPIAGIGGGGGASKPNLRPIDQPLDSGEVLRRGAIEQQRRQAQERQQSSLNR